MNEDLSTARQWLARIAALPLREPVKVMNVCGGHERSLAMLGLRAVLPDMVKLIPGPGCPVCVCPEEDLADAIGLALSGQATLAAFGDMLRVPINAPKGEIRSLAEARAAGADIQPVSSPQEVLALAKAAPDRPVVFFAAGFETTTAPVAAMLAQSVPENLSVLLAARLTWPAVDMLLNTDATALDALIAPGHVAAVMGAREWGFIPETYHLPVAVAGFSGNSLLAALYSVLRQKLENRPFLDNCYAELVQPEGNPRAKALLAEVMQVEDATWRGIGTIPASGFALRGAWRRFDARARFNLAALPRRHAGGMPPGCDCAAVVLGRKQPDQCRLYGRACTPRAPVGPCMVSDEGACHIWWQAGLRAAA
ncbi:hydrogenase formation protein HypD [Acidocella sp.]|uniref:hydrogenase formation protein HypD n=1 Tax=Acidocella sp. TaxID=50710 RepID=UPI003D08AE0B